MQLFFSCKMENVTGKILIFLIFLLKLPRQWFWIKNKKNRYTPAYPNFIGIRGYSLHRHAILMKSQHKCLSCMLYHVMQELQKLNYQSNENVFSCKNNYHAVKVYLNFLTCCVQNMIKSIMSKFKCDPQ